MTANVPADCCWREISRFQVLSSFTVQDYEKAVNKANSPAGSNLLLVYGTTVPGSRAVFMFGYEI
jgi:hypothetical protein